MDAAVQTAGAFPEPSLDCVKSDCSIGIRTKVCGRGTPVLRFSSDVSSLSATLGFGTFTIAPVSTLISEHQEAWNPTGRHINCAQNIMPIGKHCGHRCNESA